MALDFEIDVDRLLREAGREMALMKDAGDAVAGAIGTEIEKSLFRSSAGKRNVVRHLLPLIPPHKRYVEPFAGGAALFFRKDPAEEEVLNDRDPDIAFAYRFIQKLTPDRLERLRRFNWINGRDAFDAVKAKRPKNDLERFYKFIYLNRHGYFGKKSEEASFNPAHQGETFSNFGKFERGKDRLQGVTVLNEDYEKVVRRFDGAETLFFFDPPFPGYDQSVGEHEFDESRFAQVLRSIKGKFLVTYGIRSDESVFRGFKTRRIVVTQSSPRGPARRAMLLVSNYEIKKSLGPDVQDVDAAVPVSSGDAEGIAEARYLAAELSGLAVPEDVRTAARQLRDLVDRPGCHPVIESSNRRNPSVVAGELMAVLPEVRLVLRRAGGDAFTGPMRVVDRVAEAVSGMIDVPAAKQDGAAEAADEKALLEFPEKPGKRDSAIQYHFRGRSVHLDFRFDVGGWLAGWTILSQRPDSIDDPVRTIREARSIAESFSPKGDRVLKPILAPARVRATPKGKHPREWLDLNRRVIGEGEVGATENEVGVLFAVDRPDVEFGLQADDGHEYFLSGGKHVNGVLLVDRVRDGDEDFWVLSLHTARVPRVLGRKAVESGTMPPDRWSALPRALEEVTPDRFRYWERSGAEARRVRDRLVERGFFSDENIKVVGGELRHVTRKLFLTLPAGAGDEVEPVCDPAPVCDPGPIEASLPADLLKIYPRYVDPMQPVVKRGGDEERYTLGIVLEPDVVDAQGDRYTAAEVRRACHRFAEFYWNAGLMHGEIANGKIVILENYLAPADFQVTDPEGKKVTVKEGTWLQGRGYRDSEIWGMVKRGELTGLSMGGSAIRRPAEKETKREL